jgi:hypothetical protein
LGCLKCNEGVSDPIGMTDSPGLKADPEGLAGDLG